MSNKMIKGVAVSNLFWTCIHRKHGKGALKIFVTMRYLYQAQKEKCIINLRKKGYQ